MSNSKIRISTSSGAVVEIAAEDLVRLDVGVYVKEVEVVHPHECDRWASVQSSNLAGVGLEYRFGEIETDLVVEFKNGTAYRYPGLGNMFAMLKGAESAGNAFIKWVKPAKKYEKIK